MNFRRLPYLTKLYRNINLLMIYLNCLVSYEWIKISCLSLISFNKFFLVIHARIPWNSPLVLPMRLNWLDFSFFMLSFRHFWLASLFISLGLASLITNSMPISFDAFVFHFLLVILASVVSLWLVASILSIMVLFLSILTRILMNVFIGVHVMVPVL